MSNDSGYDSEIFNLKKQFHEVRRDRVNIERNITSVQNRLSLLYVEETKVKKSMINDIECRLRGKNILNDKFKFKAEMMKV
jgi:hypothetical protein